MEQEIIKLTKLWYSIVNLDYHKDQDCHWYIIKEYSYGKNPTYRVEHNGYALGGVSDEYGSIKEAHKGLIATISEAIKRERAWAQGVLQSRKEFAVYQVKDAKKIIKLTEHL